jgi:hypothetical protein
LVTVELVKDALLAKRLVEVELEKGTQAIVEKTAKPNAYFKVSGWKDAATIDYELVVL